MVQEIEHLLSYALLFNSSTKNKKVTSLANVACMQLTFSHINHKKIMIGSFKIEFSRFIGLAHNK
jgi:hypothetical protein